MAVVLGGSALIGRVVLDLFGISLAAFGVAGGIVVDPQPLSAEDSIPVPYAIPSMAALRQPLARLISRPPDADPAPHLTRLLASAAEGDETFVRTYEGGR